MARKRIEEAWDKLSDYYQSSRRISLENFHYGAYAPGEQDLKIIGEVTGLDILDLGCGGGQNSVVLKKQGAKTVTAIDQSEKQIEYARRLASETDVEIRFVKSDMENLLAIEDESFDLVVSSHAMNYALNLERVFAECNRILRDEGRLVICMNHPLWIVVGEALETGNWSKLVNYFEGLIDIWDWKSAPGNVIATFESRSWRLEHIFNGLVGSGFRIERVAEPRGYSEEELKSLPPDAVPYYDIGKPNTGFIRANRIVPSSLIISAVKLDSGGIEIGSFARGSTTKPEP